MQALTDLAAPVAPSAFLADLLLYRDRLQPGAFGLKVSAARTADHSFGRPLHLGEVLVRALLGRLERWDYSLIWL
jgi:hypothetical protein